MSLSSDKILKKKKLKKIEPKAFVLLDKDNKYMAFNRYCLLFK